MTVPPVPPDAGSGAPPPAAEVAPPPGEPVSLSLVVATIGRPAALARLLDSVDTAGPGARTEVVLVDQSPDRASTALLRGRTTADGWTMTTAASGPGVGAARRAGVAAAHGTVVAIPNDDCRYDPGVLGQVLARFATDPGLAALSGRQLTGDGRDSSLRWASAAGPVTRATFHRRSIASTLFFRRDALLAAGSIRADIGTGSPGPFGAGEDSDAVLRLLARGGRVLYDPSLVVRRDPPPDVAGWVLVAKMARYGRGQGHLWQVHRLSRTRMAARLVRKAGAAAVHLGAGHPVVAAADLAFAAGWVDGFRRAHPARGGTAGAVR